MSHAFFSRDALEVAPDLIGKLLISNIGGRRTSGWIVETEAYRHDDPASHAFRGQTKRNSTMFVGAGKLYVYRSMGIHACANIVTGNDESGQAVLLRALEPLDGIDTMIERRGLESLGLLCAGPGRLCQALAIGLENDGLDLMGNDVHISDGGRHPAIACTPRIGITKNIDAPWRFVDPKSEFLSRPWRR